MCVEGQMLRLPTRVALSRSRSLEIHLCSGALDVSNVLISKWTDELSQNHPAESGETPRFRSLARLLRRGRVSRILRSCSQGRPTELGFLPKSGRNHHVHVLDILFN